MQACKKYLTHFILLYVATASCNSQSLNAHYQDAKLQTVQLIDAKGAAIGGKAQYISLRIESKQNLAEFTKGLLQFRAYVVLPNGERFLTLGANAIEAKNGYFVPYNQKNAKTDIEKQTTYSAFFFRDLILDYEGTYKINLLKDSYQKIEFDMSYRVFAGPQLARSTTFSLTQAEFLKLFETRKNDAGPVVLVMENE